jgi:hypothetical protein
MRRPNLRAFMVALLVAFGALPAIASPVTANVGGCATNNNGPHTFTGRYSSTDRTGVRAEIDPSNTEFNVCTGGAPGNAGGGVSAWIALTSLTALGGAQDAQVQIGMTRCNANAAPCNGSATLHYFYQVFNAGVGGCINKNAVDLGAVGSFGPKIFRIDYVVDPSPPHHVTLTGWIDKEDGHGYQQQFTFDATTDPSTSCWITSQHRAHFFAERFDIGDSIGSSTDRTHFIDMKTEDGGSWTLFGDSSTTCSFADSGSTCDFVGDGDMDMWDA